MTTPSTSDEYARKFMGGERVRFLDKVRIPLWMHLAMLGGGIAGAAAALASGVPLAALFVGATSFVSWGVLTTIRVSVTDAFVYVQYGLWGPKIALGDVVDVEVIDYKALQYGGWGIRRNLKGERAFSVPGRGGRAVKIRYRDGAADKVRTVVVSSEQPDALKLAIDQARGTQASAELDAAARTEEEAQQNVDVEVAARK